MVLLSSTNLLPSGLISSVFIKLYGHSVPSLHTMTDLVHFTTEKQKRLLMVLVTMNQTFNRANHKLYIL